MTREQVKKALPLIQAFVEGKTIQTKNGSKWIDIDSDKNQLILDSVVTYQDCFRIKPEPSYRPFRNVEECWQEMLKHAPFGIMSSKNSKDYMSFKSLNDEGCETERRVADACGIPVVGVIGEAHDLQIINAI